MRKVLALLSLVVMAAGPASAESDSPLTALITGEDVRGWEGVGRLNLGRSGFCTAALIAPDVLLTAAHCIYDRQSGALIDTAEMEFLAGWRNNRATAYRGVRHAIPHPDYDIAASGDAMSSGVDIAILKLDQPIRNLSVRPFGVSNRPRKGTAVDVVSYAHDRANRPSLQQGCHVLARPSDSLILSCLVDFGSSGAPVFVTEDGEPRIVSVVSSMSEIRGRPVSLGSALSEPLQELQAILAAHDANRTETSSGVRRLTLDEGRGSNGAKFLRP